MNGWTKTSFALDSLADQMFKGYSTGDRWNSWACPYFERHEAESVLRASESNEYTWRYDIQSDAFIVRSAADPEHYEAEVFAGVKTNIDGINTTLYGIGANAWVWEEVVQTR